MTRQTTTAPRRRTTRLMALATIGCLAATVAAVGTPAAAAGSTRVPGAHPRASDYGFDRPFAIAVADGNLWIANFNGNSVSEVSTSGAPLAVISGSNYGFNEPDGIAVDGNLLFVVNRGGSVTELNATDGSFIRLIKGTKYGFKGPNAPRVHDGNVWVADTSGNSITEFSAKTGDLVRVLRDTASHPVRFDEPTAMAVAGDDLWVVNRTGGSSGNAIYGSLTVINTANGQKIAHYDSTTFGMQRPEGIAFAAGHLWVSDSNTSAVTEVGTGGHLDQIVDSAAYGFNAPSVVRAHDGMVYVISPTGASPMVTQINAQTAAADWFECNNNNPSPAWLNPTGVAAEGTSVWVVSPATNTLTQLTKDNGQAINWFPSQPSL